MCDSTITVDDCLENAPNAHASLPAALADVINDLACWESPVPFALLADRIGNLEVTIDDVRPFVRGSRAGYGRTVIAGNERFQALVICWLPGQFSPIHDHGGSACTVRVIQGRATETAYRLRPDGLVEALHSQDMTAGQTTAADDDDIHALGNLAENDLPLVTLHVYSPPIADFSTYSEARGPGATFAAALATEAA